MLSDLLPVQLEFLKLEVESINTTIGRLDEITKNIKQWTILAWTAAVGGALTDRELRPFIGATAAIPLLFWLVDTWHRRIQRKFIWRNIVISRFLNDGRLAKSVEEGRLVGFALLDPKSRLEQTADYHNFTSWRRVMLFRSLSILYLGMIIISLALGIASWVDNSSRSLYPAGTRHDLLPHSGSTRGSPANSAAAADQKALLPGR